MSRIKRNLIAKTITLAHGSGGKAMHDLIDDVFVNGFDNSHLDELEDQAKFDISELTKNGDRLAMTTDSFVVDPLFCPISHIFPTRLQFQPIGKRRSH